MEASVSRIAGAGDAETTISTSTTETTAVGLVNILL